MEEDGFDNVPKAVLRPRHPGESLKVAQVVLKRRERNIKAAADRAKQLAAIKQGKREWERNDQDFKRLEKLVQNSRKRKIDMNRLKRMRKMQLKKVKNRPPSILVFRNGRKGGSKQTKAALQWMGIRNRFTAVFLPCDERTDVELAKCKPFIFWGRPLFKTVYNLLHKKVTIKDPDVPDKRIFLSDNNMIEKHLGHLGVLCVEDLVDIIWNRRKNFDQVVALMWPTLVGNLRKAKGMVHEIKEKFGYRRGREFNDLITRIIGE